MLGFREITQRQGIKVLLLSIFLALTSGCHRVGNVFNPFYEPPAPVALLGDKNDHALSGKEEKIEKARGALDAMASYRRAQDPEPVYPVINPAVIRLMWIPDHLNKNGDMVPSHYYYLKVKGDTFAVQDEFDLQKQLGGPSGSSSNIPYVNEGEKVN